MQRGLKERGSLLIDADSLAALVVDLVGIAGKIPGRHVLCVRLDLAESTPKPSIDTHCADCQPGYSPHAEDDQSRINYSGQKPLP